MDSNNIEAIERLLQQPQYSLSQSEKSSQLVEELQRLTEFHQSRCSAYCRVLTGIPSTPAAGSASTGLETIPFIPVRLFKSLKLQSVPDEEVIKVLTSSGTTSQQVSRISLDAATSRMQTRALASIITSFVGPKRLPMILVDSRGVLKSGSSMSARGAGLVGLSNFGHSHLYALNDDLRLNLSRLLEFSEAHRGKPVLIFGFTYMVWEYLCQELKRQGTKIDLSSGILIHSGGWKKLASQGISNEVFKNTLQEQCGIKRVHNFYGMVEQVGGVYMECEAGFFHAPNIADILIRNPRDLRLVPFGEQGVVQTLSVLARSYPGHSLLTEDLGVVHGIDDCPCGRMGVRFRLDGRIPRAELRGCSDTHAFSEATSLDEKDLTQLVPSITKLEGIEQVCTSEFTSRQPLPAFNEISLEFLELVSLKLLKTISGREYPELTALGFWLRKASLRKIADSFLQSLAEGEQVQPLGLVFHIAPANVDTIFIYSWALALMSGNLNVVRVSQHITPRMRVLLGIVSEVLNDERMSAIRQRNVILTYPHDNEASQFISRYADARLIWGGDQTVQRIRSLPARPTTREISFADKVSSCLLDSRQYVMMEEDARRETARAFYNDAYQFDQLACSSPLFVVFAGSFDTNEKASRLFWDSLSEELQRRKHSEAVSTSMDRFVRACEMMGQEPGARWRGCLSTPGLTVVHLPIERANSCRSRLGGGFFIECFVEDAKQLGSVVQRGDQTLTYIGYSRQEMAKLASELAVNGIDRIVPAGHALNFEPVWDGLCLLSELTRRVTVR